MGKCSLGFNIFLSFLGVIFGFSGFLVFTFYYRNIAAGIFALLSGFLAAKCFVLHYGFLQSNLSRFYDVNRLKSIADYSFILAVVAGAFFIWFLFITFYYHIPMMPVEGSSTISAVWSVMTLKWGLQLRWTCKKYSRCLYLGYAPLVVSVPVTDPSDVSIY